MKKKLLLLLVSLNVYCGLSQERYNIRGGVKDQDKPLIGADVVLHTIKDSVLMSGVITNDLGGFMISDIEQGNYILSVHYIGFKKYLDTIRVDEGDINLGTIIMEKDNIRLDEVVLKSNLPTIQRKPDRTVLNIENSIYSTGENGYNLLRIAPEIRTDGLGNINFRGQQGVIVYVDERRIRLSAQQLMLYLRSIPSESIKSIEIYSVPSAQFDAAGNAAIINIITKKDYRYGLSGNISSYYEQHRFPGAGGGLQLNYRSRKFTLSSSYNYSVFNFYNDIDQTFEYQNYSPTLFFDQEDKYRETYNSHSVDFGVGYDISKNKNIGVRYRLDYVDWDMRYNSLADVFSTPANIDSILTTRTKEDEFLNNQSLNAYFEYETDTLGSKLLIDYEYIAYKNPSDGFYKSNFLNSEEIPMRPADSSYIYNPIEIDINVFKVDFDKRFKKKWVLKAGAKYSFIDTDNTNTFFTRDSESNVIVDENRSNKFVYDEDIFALYSSISRDWDKWSFNLGLRLENTKYRGKSITIDNEFNRNRLDLFPSIFLQRKLGENHLINLSYGRRILRPAYEKLNPFIDYENPYSYSVGNPSLNPAFSSSIEGMYLYKGKYSLNLGYKRTSDLIGELLTKEDDITVISTYENLNDEDYYFVSSYVPIKINNWYSFNNYLNLYHKEINVSQGDNEGDYKQTTLLFYGSHTFTVSEDLSIELNGYFQSKSLYTIYESKSQGAVNLSLKKTLLDESLSINLSFYDIFNTQKSRIIANFGDVYRRSSSQFASQMIKLSVSYNFRSGKKEVENIERDSPGSSEKDRID
ncbi:outer membrane beta-barrel family protein [Sinomicrobium oceani]|uniref:outer membrane beta-barrel family protein n=1 Tax=Sinomicrobium oceani TaxID=1150368 RepID=UPI00227A78FF|nr:outer membrane beta-barrel family protein [Sinomicrobium oceani]